MSVFAGVSSSLFPKKIHPKKKKLNRKINLKKKNIPKIIPKNIIPPKKSTYYHHHYYHHYYDYKHPKQKSSHKKMLDSFFFDFIDSSISTLPSTEDPYGLHLSHRRWPPVESPQNEGKKIVANPSNNQEMMGFQKG